MKQVKIAFNKCKMKMPNRPPDEIDFGLGFRAALEMLSAKLKQLTDPPNCRCLPYVQEIIDEELKNGNY